MHRQRLRVVRPILPRIGLNSLVLATTTLFEAATNVFPPDPKGSLPASVLTQIKLILGRRAIARFLEIPVKVA